MRAGLYIRVSTDEQAAEGYSVAAQKTLLERKCKEWGFELTKHYIDDGYSAKDMRRPALQGALEDVKNRNIDVIIFWRLDRFTRRTRDFQKMSELLEKHNCGIKSATEQIDTTNAMGRFQLELTISLGQLERETTAERVKFVMEDRHRKGKRNGAVSPYGYELIEGKLVVNEKESEIVKRIYELYRVPMSTRAIAKLFNAEGLPKRELSKWSDFSVQYILTNPVYCGRLRWNYRKLSGKRTYQEIIVDSDHEPIISQEEFDEVQRMRAKRFFKREKVSSDFHFTGVLRCARCGYGMVGLTQRDNKTGKYGRYYRCIGRSNYGVCNMPILKEEIIVNVFLQQLDPESEMFKRMVSVDEYIPVEEDYEQETIERELETIQRRRRKWQDAYANDVITLEDLKTRMDEERHREETLKAKLEPAAAQEKSQWEVDEIKEVLSSFGKLWHTIEDEATKKAFVQDAFKSIVVNTPVERGVGGPGRKIPVNIVDINLNI